MDLETAIAVASIALPLIAKASVDLAGYLADRKHAALARIVGMAGRQAATAARAISSMPPGQSAGLERSLIQAGASQLMEEMAQSAKTAGADPAKMTAILQGELDKVLPPLLVATEPRNPLEDARKLASAVVPVREIPRPPSAPLAAPVWPAP